MVFTFKKNKLTILFQMLSMEMTGNPMDMGTPFDHYSEKAHHSYTDLPEIVIKNRKRLHLVMEHAGLKALDTEWWHYCWEHGSFDVLDLNFDDLNATSSLNLQQIETKNGNP